MKAAAVVVAALALLCASAAAQAAPVIGARASILVEEDTGTVITSNNANTELPIASTTKMMTALVTVEHEPLTRVLTVAPYAATPGESLSGVAAGERLTVADLLRAMLLPSGNDIAHSLALSVGGSIANFVAMMNATAARLHLGRTHYATPVGLDTPGNYSTAADLAKLAAALEANKYLAQVVDMHSAVLADGRTVINEDPLIGAYPFVIGVKTGHTDAAGYCLVGAGVQGDVHLISVVLGEATRADSTADTLALLRYGLSLYHRVMPVVAGRVYAKLAVNSERVNLVASRSLSLVVRRGTQVEVYVVGVAPTVATAPEAGAPAGAVDVRLRGRLVASIPLIVSSAPASD